MCGRYAITLPPQAMRDFYRYVEQPNFPARYNVAPTQPIPVVRGDAGGARHFGLVRWGLLPPFVKEPKTFPLLISARAEGIADKPSFRAAMRRGRCLIVADAWYEWRLVGHRGAKPVKVPFLFRRRDGRPLLMAGLTQTWSDPLGGEIETGCTITTAANGAASAIHDRMPALLDEAGAQAWLDVENVRAEVAAALLRPAPDDDHESFEIGPDVNRVANDGPALHEPAQRADLFDGATR